MNFLPQNRKKLFLIARKDLKKADFGDIIRISDYFVEKEVFMLTHDNEIRYIRDVALAEKSSFFLSLLRDALQIKSDSCKEASANADSVFNVEQPEPVQCKLKNVPDEPQLDEQGNKVLTLCRYLIYGAGAAFLLSVMFFIILIFKLDFFKIPFAESGFIGKGLIVLIAAGVGLLVASIVLRQIEMNRFNEIHKSWENVKEQINLQNLAEIDRCRELEEKQNQEYYMTMEMIKEKRVEYALKQAAKAEIYALLKAKVANAITSLEKTLTAVYGSAGVLPSKCRRFDAVLMLESYLERDDVNSLSDALGLYNSECEVGNVADHISDFRKNGDGYFRGMTAAYEFIRLCSDSVEALLAKNEAFAELIADKSITPHRGELNRGTLAIEFTKNYGQSDIGAELESIADSCKAMAQKY